MIIPKRPRMSVDTECYRDYFLAGFTLVDAPDVTYDFEMFPGQPLDRQSIATLLSQFTIVTFNGITYDVPMLTGALLGYDNEQLKWLSDKIIVGNLKPWDVERELNIVPPNYIDNIDLIEVMPGQHGLKMYMAKMHSRRIQDLPIAPSASIAPDQRPLMREYCQNDRLGNIDALRKFSKEIQLREKMSGEYGIDLRSKSDAQMAEAVIKIELKRLGVSVDRPVWAVGTWFNYEPPAFLQYQTPMLQQLLEMVRTAKFYLGENGVEMPPELDSAKIILGSSAYRLGIGGLHSSESSVYHIADDDTVISDHDVRGYYPSLMIAVGMYPPQIGPVFQPVFKSIVDRRNEAKDVFQALEETHGKPSKMSAAIAEVYGVAKSTADSLKIVGNSTFGKTLSKYGILSAPKMGIQVTVTGQLSLLMLIEMLHVCGIPVISANTDGIVIKCPRSLVWLRDQCIKDWEARTGLETEANEYVALFSRDVNNYIAVKAKDRSVKLKGAYAPPVPVGGSWPNPTGEVCVDAIVDYLLKGVPLEQTIRACTDVRKFVYIRTVKGGGQMVHGVEVAPATTKAGMRMQLAQAGWSEISREMFDKTHSFADLEGPLPMKDAHKLAILTLRKRNLVPKEYLGKVVRWYYARGSTGSIRYVGSGNLVAKTEGCMPLMTLPDTLPADINYDWYVAEAKSMITDMGVAML